MKSVFPKEVKVESFEIKDNCLELHFNKAYEKMKSQGSTLQGGSCADACSG